MGRKLSKIYTSCHTFQAILCTLLLFATPAIAQNSTGNIVSSSARPVKVVDGDSLEIGTTRIRLMGIDAPEYDQSCKDANGRLYPCGRQSADFLAKLVQGKTVTCHIHHKDKYKRDLCTCYVDGLDINAEMIRTGHAIVYLESSYDNLQKEAQKQKAGIWNGLFMHPRLFRLIKYHQKKALMAN